MKKPRALLPAVAMMALTCYLTPTLAQEVVLSDPGLDAAVRATLKKPVGPLTQQDMLGLTFLNAHDRNISNLAGLEAARNLNTLLLFNNQLTNFSLPTLTNLVALTLSGNSLTNVSLPAGLKNLFSLLIGNNPLAQLTLPTDLTGLEELGLQNCQLTSFNLPAGMTGLGVLDLAFNALTNVSLPGGLTNLDLLKLNGNSLTNFIVPPGQTRLSQLYLDENQLASFTLPAGVTNLHVLDLSFNQLTNLSLPGDQRQLISLELDHNRLTSLTLPPGLTNLVNLVLSSNQLAELTLPPDLTHLNSLALDGNPLTQLVLSEPQATNLAATIVTLQNRGIPVFPYPLDIKLTKLIQPVGAFRFGITGPPGFYTVLSSTNLMDWSRLDVVNNPLGSVFFLDPTAQFSPQKFYRAQPLTTPPANLVFIPANTFLLGSPTNEVGHQADESPQTIVRLSRGYWIGKYEVTQREYLAVTGENPSGFPGDLDRPVESVSFFAASNYCFLLTAQDLAAGRIPLGTHYRLPTEAEWECAARAGNTNRFYYGDDPSLTNLTNYAWFGAHDGITTHPVGLKLPNAWGLYDMAGNVWEWCQDWYGNYPGGTVTDPQGPATNPIGWKVIRGGAWEASEFDCRSASRWFEGASPFISDFIIGFRVVLVAD
ncbi:MAG: SUMF1/EgtB/PvdO family nonheme iron enzyme [Verrucomicrobiota bacterium]